MAAIKSAGSVTITLNSNDITQYCNSDELQSTVNALEATDLASTAMESDPGLGAWTLSIGGDWNSTIDGFLGPDTITPTKRSVELDWDDGSTEVSYDWTNQGFITNFTISAPADGKMTWSATLNLSGNPSRSTA